MNRNEIIAWFVMIVPPIAAFVVLWSLMGFWHALLAHLLFGLSFVALLTGMRILAAKDDDWWG